MNPEKPKTPLLLSHAASIASVEAYNTAKERSRRSDQSMKDLLKNARFSGALLIPLLKELQDISLGDFCRYTGTDVDTGNSLTGETELGSTYTKDIRLDVIFEYHALSQTLLRINEEPHTRQQTFRESDTASYSIVGRAVYYAATAMTTELKDTEHYHLLRKVYSVWICYKRPIAELTEPIISYSLQPDKNYYYRDGTPLTSCKRKFDNGDLLGIILISVPDVERIYTSGIPENGCSMETIRILHYLLTEQVETEQRFAFYYEHEIIKKGSERVSYVSMVEKYERLTRELEERTLQTCKEAEEKAQMAERMAEQKAKQMAEQMAKQIAEQMAEQMAKQMAEQMAKQIAEQMAKQIAEQMAEQSIMKTIIELCSELNLAHSVAISKISEKMGVSMDKAQLLYDEYKNSWKVSENQ